MKPSATDLRSPLSKAKGLGASKHAVGHWWYQRVTAIALIPLTLWFVAGILSALISPDITTAQSWVASPINSLLLCLTIGALFLHAKLGMQVVIEDYIKCPCAKYGLLLGNLFFSFAGAALGIIAVLKLHFAG